MSNWDKFKKIVGLDKNETMNKEELIQETEEQIKDNSAVETDANEEGTENAAAAISETDELKAQIEQLKADKAELNDKYLRMFAEFQNYKRRTAKEKLDVVQTAGRDVIKTLLPVVDDFNRAKKAADSVDSIETFSEGVQLVYEKLHHVLRQQGLKALETNGELFNPDIHEALTEIPAPSEDMKGKIIDTVESGYTLNDKIIRFAKVVIGR